MPQIKRYIFAILTLFSLNLWGQKSIEDDPEIIQNSIDYCISQSDLDIENFDYFEVQKKLDDALEIAIKAENKTSIGIIYSKKNFILLLKSKIKLLNPLMRLLKYNAPMTMPI